MITSGDFLAGGGGLTYAMNKLENVEPIWVLNHDHLALRVNVFNNPNVKPFIADIYKQSEKRLPYVDFAHASIECTTQSRANGGNKQNLGSYMLGFELVRYVKHLMFPVLGIENVPEFKNWGPVRIREDKKHSTTNYSALKVSKKCEYVWELKPETKGQYFKEWKKQICDLGYDYHESIRNAADDGFQTRRVRYFAFFTRKDLQLKVNWPQQTHSKDGKDGFKKWVSCRPYLDLTNEGESIFGREFNDRIPKQHRHLPCHNTLKRIAAGIKKHGDEVYSIMQYYGTGDNVQSLNSPINTVTTKDRHVLIKYEKLHFIQDYCHADLYSSIDEPMPPQLTWQTKQLVTASKAQFLTVQQNSNGNPGSNTFSLDDPTWAITTEQKIQFVTAYINNIDEISKDKLTSSIRKGLIDFDIKTRFLTAKELEVLSTFPQGYFTNHDLKLNTKQATKLIGNAVPPEWAKKIIKPVIDELDMILSAKREAV